MIEIFGIPIAEPMTTLTDYLLAAVSAYLAWRLFQQTAGQRSRKYWALASIFIGLAAFWGGTYHGFQAILSETQLVFCWQMVVYSVGLSTFFCTYGTAIATLPFKLHKWMLSFALIKLAVCIIWVQWNTAFLYVIIDYLIALLFIVAMQTYAKFRQGAPSYNYILAGVIVFFIGTGVQRSGIALHEYLNHNDLLHLLQIVAVVLFYRGTLLFFDVPKL